MSSEIQAYFDHYLTQVYPEQLKRAFDQHNADPKAHPVAFRMIAKTSRRVNRSMWLLAGGSAVAGFLLGLAPQLAKMFFKG